MTGVSTLDERQLVAAATVLAASHLTDPAMAWVYPRSASRTASLAALFRLALADVHRCGQVEVAVSDGHVVGAAAWLPPGAFPIPWRRQVRSAPAFARLAATAPSALPRLMRFTGACTAAFPAAPRWQLNVVGVRPDRQGRGVGTALLGNRMRDIGDDLHLETWNPANLPFYRRFGFDVTATDRPLGPTGPRRWTLGRPSREDA